jgi:hypothetical protein
MLQVQKKWEEAGMCSNKAARRLPLGWLARPHGASGFMVGLGGPLHLRANSAHHTSPRSQFTALTLHSHDARHTAGSAAFITRHAWLYILLHSIHELVIMRPQPPSSRRHFITPYKDAFFLNALMSPLVLASCDVDSPASSSSAWIFLARLLPSSTPHWSKLLMFQMAPSVKVRCS